MAEQQWYAVKDAASLLGMSSPDALRRWLKKGRDEKWIRVGVHIKRRTYGSIKSPWMVHVERCQAIGTKK